MASKNDVFPKDFGEVIRINKLKLDDAAVENPNLILMYGEQMAIAKAERDAAKEALNLTKSEVEMMYRENPPDGVKITESVVSALVTSNERVIAAVEAHLEAQKKVYLLEVIMSALDDRRSEIKNLTQLWIGGYYGEHTGGQGRGREDIIDDESGSEIRSRMKKRAAKFEE